MDNAAHLDTQLADLTEVSLSQLRRQPRDTLAPFLNRMLEQVKHPRYNLGSGPPGRVD